MKWVADLDTAYFRCGQNDQKLYFKSDNKADIYSFLMYCQGKQNIHVEEAMVPEKSIVQDEFRQPYLSEFILTIQHQLTLTGEEWIYVELYCHYTQSDIILVNHISKIIETHIDKIAKWFFTRYDQPAPHVRIRMKLIDKSDFQNIVSAFTRRFKNNLLNGLIHDFQIKTYFSEIQRYGYNSIEKVETCFWLSSIYVLALLSNTHYRLRFYNITMNLMEYILDQCGFNLKQQLSLFKSTAAVFAKEMNLKNDSFKKINKAFKELQLSDIGEKVTKKDLPVQQEIMIKEFIITIDSYNIHTKNKLIADLFHMHINRLFSANQRMHELIIYHYLVIRIQKKIMVVSKAV